MFLLYSFLLTCGALVLLPYFLFKAFRHGKYLINLRERLGDVPTLEQDATRPVVWLHCVSVGETQAARPLVRQLLAEYPLLRLVVSTTTLTGQKIAREVFGREAAAIIYFPFDWTWTVRRALARINPSLVLIMETEIWFNFLRECRRREIKVAIVNGRLSEKSFARYRVIKPLLRRVFDSVSLAVMQGEADATRIKNLGINSQRVQVSGNIKFDFQTDESESPLTKELRVRFDFGRNVNDGTRALLVAASTHAMEEEIVLRAWQRLAQSVSPAPRLLIAPRHPERFAEVAKLIENSGEAWTRRSAEAQASDQACDIVLLDSIGELPHVYPLATVVFVGGSIAPVGGHNILEPAAHGACIITGAHTHNFAQIVRQFRERDALVQLPLLDKSDAAHELLAREIETLLTDATLREAMCECARQTLTENRGATARTIQYLAPLIAPLVNQNMSAHNQPLTKNVDGATIIARGTSPVV